MPFFSENSEKIQLFSRTSDKRRKKKKRRKSKSKSKSPKCLLEDEATEVVDPKETSPNNSKTPTEDSATRHLAEDDKKDDEAARLIFQLKSKRCTTAKNVFAQGKSSCPMNQKSFFSPKIHF